MSFLQASEEAVSGAAKKRKIRRSKSDCSMINWGGGGVGKSRYQKLYI